MQEKDLQLMHCLTGCTQTGHGPLKLPKHWKVPDEGWDLNASQLLMNQQPRQYFSVVETCSPPQQSAASSSNDSFANVYARESDIAATSALPTAKKAKPSIPQPSTKATQSEPIPQLKSRGTVGASSSLPTSSKHGPPVQPKAPPPGKARRSKKSEMAEPVPIVPITAPATPPGVFVDNPLHVRMKDETQLDADDDMLEEYIQDELNRIAELES